MIYQTAEPPSAWALRFNTSVTKLWDAVKVSASGVVHGHGVVARRDLACGDELTDPSVIYVASKPPVGKRKGPGHYIAYSTGYFKVHCFPEDVCRKTATTFWLNEARGVKPNITWKVHRLKDRMELAWKLLSDVRAGEELVVCYHHVT